MKTLEELKKLKESGNTTSTKPTSDSNFGDIVRSAIGQGFMLGYGDEAEAFVRSLGSKKRIQRYCS